MAGYAGIRRGDVAVFLRRGEGQLVKRIIGLPGERLEIRAGKIWINDAPIDEPHSIVQGSRTDTLLQSSGWTWNDYGPVLLAETFDELREYFVMGDNRDISIDSRVFGRIAEEQIIGTVSFPDKAKKSEQKIDTLILDSHK